MRKIGISLLILSSVVFAKQNIFSLGYLLNDSDLEKEKSKEVVKATNQKKYNSIISKITTQKQTDFVLKSPKTIDIYVRENYNVLDNQYVIKQPEHWIKVLVKENQLWY